MACNNCGKPSDTCGTVLPSTCIEWVGSLPECMESEDCIDSLEDVLAIYGEKICELASQIDLTGLDEKCLSISAPFTINAVIQNLIDQFCPIIDLVNEHEVLLNNILIIEFDGTQLTWPDCFDLGPCLEPTDLNTLQEVLQTIINEICDNASTNCMARISADDECCGFLEDKLVEGDNITITTVTDEDGCKTLVISAADPNPLLTVQNGYDPPTQSESNVTTLIANGFAVVAGANPGEAVLKQRVTSYECTPEDIEKSTDSNFTLFTSEAVTIMGHANYPLQGNGLWHLAEYNAYQLNDANISYDSNTGEFIINESGFYNVYGRISLNHQGQPNTRWGSAGWIKAGLVDNTVNEYISTTQVILDTVTDGTAFEVKQGATTIIFSGFLLQFSAGQRIRFRVLNKTDVDYEYHNPTDVGGGFDSASLAFVKLFDTIP